MAAEKVKTSKIIKSVKTDKALADLAASHEQAIIREYAKAAVSIRSELAALAAKDVLTQQDMFKFNRLATLEKNIYKEMDKVTMSVAAKLKAATSQIFQESFYRSAFDIEQTAGANLSFTKLSPAAIQSAVDNPLDRYGTGKQKQTLGFLMRNKANQAAVKQKVTQDVTQGLVLGESYQQISARIDKQLNTGANNALRIARTESGRCQTLGKVQAFVKAKTKGINVKMEWVATLDNRTRDKHSHMDGKLENENGFFEFPGIGEVQGPHLTGTAEDINCRCTVRGVLPDYEDGIDLRRTKTEGVIQYETYDDYAVKKGWPVYAPTAADIAQSILTSALGAKQVFNQSFLEQSPYFQNLAPETKTLVLKNITDPSWVEWAAKNPMYTEIADILKDMNAQNKILLDKLGNSAAYKKILAGEGKPNVMTGLMFRQEINKAIMQGNMDSLHILKGVAKNTPEDKIFHKMIVEIEEQAKNINATKIKAIEIEKAANEVAKAIEAAQAAVEAEAAKKAAAEALELQITTEAQTAGVDVDLYKSIVNSITYKNAAQGHKSKFLESAIKATKGDFEALNIATQINDILGDDVLKVVLKDAFDEAVAGMPKETIFGAIDIIDNSALSATLKKNFKKAYSNSDIKYFEQKLKYGKLSPENEATINQVLDILKKELKPEPTNWVAVLTDLGEGQSTIDCIIDAYNLKDLAELKYLKELLAGDELKSAIQKMVDEVAISISNQAAAGFNLIDKINAAAIPDDIKSKLLNAYQTKDLTVLNTYTIYGDAKPKALAKEMLYELSKAPTISVEKEAMLKKLDAFIGLNDAKKIEVKDAVLNNDFAILEAFKKQTTSFKNQIFFEDLIADLNAAIPKSTSIDQLGAIANINQNIKDDIIKLYNANDSEGLIKISNLSYTAIGNKHDLQPVLSKMIAEAKLKDPITQTAVNLLDELEATTLSAAHKAVIKAAYESKGLEELQAIVSMPTSLEEEIIATKMLNKLTLEKSAKEKLYNAFNAANLSNDKQSYAYDLFKKIHSPEAKYQAGFLKDELKYLKDAGYPKEVVDVIQESIDATLQGTLLEQFNKIASESGKKFIGKAYTGKNIDELEEALDIYKGKPEFENILNQMIAEINAAAPAKEFTEQIVIKKINDIPWPASDTKYMQSGVDIFDEAIENEMNGKLQQFIPQELIDTLDPTEKAEILFAGKNANVVQDDFQDLLNHFNFNQDLILSKTKVVLPEGATMDSAEYFLNLIENSTFAPSLKTVVKDEFQKGNIAFFDYYKNAFSPKLNKLIDEAGTFLKATPAPVQQSKLLDKLYKAKTKKNLTQTIESAYNDKDVEDLKAILNSSMIKQVKVKQIVQDMIDELEANAVQTAAQQAPLNVIQKLEDLYSNAPASNVKFDVLNKYNIKDIEGLKEVYDKYNNIELKEIIVEMVEEMGDTIPKAKLSLKFQKVFGVDDDYEKQILSLYDKNQLEDLEFLWETFDAYFDDSSSQAIIKEMIDEIANQQIKSTDYLIDKIDTMFPNASVKKNLIKDAYLNNDLQYLENKIITNTDPNMDIILKEMIEDIKSKGNIPSAAISIEDQVKNSVLDPLNKNVLLKAIDDPTENNLESLMLIASKKGTIESDLAEKVLNDLIKNQFNENDLQMLQELYNAIDGFPSVYANYDELIIIAQKAVSDLELKVQKEKLISNKIFKVKSVSESGKDKIINYYEAGDIVKLKEGIEFYKQADPIKYADMIDVIDEAINELKGVQITPAASPDLAALEAAVTNGYSKGIIKDLYTDVAKFKTDPALAEDSLESLVYWVNGGSTEIAVVNYAKALLDDLASKMSTNELGMLENLKSIMVGEDVFTVQKMIDTIKSASQTTNTNFIPDPTIVQKILDTKNIQFIEKQAVTDPYILGDLEALEKLYAKNLKDFDPIFSPPFLSNIEEAINDLKSKLPTPSAPAATVLPGAAQGAAADELIEIVAEDYSQKLAQSTIAQSIKEDIALSYKKKDVNDLIFLQNSISEQHTKDTIEEMIKQIKLMPEGVPDMTLKEQVMAFIPTTEDDITNFGFAGKVNLFEKGYDIKSLHHLNWKLNQADSPEIKKIIKAMIDDVQGVKKHVVQPKTIMVKKSLLNMPAAPAVTPAQAKAANKKIFEKLFNVAETPYQEKTLNNIIKGGKMADPAFKELESLAIQKGLKAEFDMLDLAEINWAKTSKIAKTIPPKIKPAAVNPTQIAVKEVELSEETKEAITKITKEIEEIQEEMQAFPKKTYTGLWKDDVTVEQYLEKQGGIQAKKDYFNQKLGYTTDQNEIDKFKKLLVDIDDFETEGIEFAKIISKERAKLKELRKLQPVNLETGAVLEKVREAEIYLKTHPLGKGFKVDGEQIENNRLTIKQAEIKNLKTGKTKEQYITRVKFTQGELADIEAAFKKAKAKKLQVYPVMNQQSRSSTFKLNMWSDTVDSVVYELEVDGKLLYFVPESGEASLKGSLMILSDEIEEVGDVFEMIGKSDLLRFSTFEDLEKSRLRHIIYQYEPDKFIPAGTNIDTLEQMARKYSKANVDNVVEEEILPNYFTFKEVGRSEEFKQYGAKELFSGVGHNADNVVSIFEAEANVCINERVVSYGFNGSSAQSDINSGGANYFFTRIMTKDSVNNRTSQCFAGSGYRVHIDISELDRLDWFGYHGDKFGTVIRSDYRKRNDAHTHVKKQCNSWTSGNEIMFKNGINTKSVFKISCDGSSMRSDLISKFQSKGITHINGVKVEDFIVVSQQQIIK